MGSENSQGDYVTIPAPFTSSELANDKGAEWEDKYLIHVQKEFSILCF